MLLTVGHPNVQRGYNEKYIWLKLTLKRNTPEEKQIDIKANETVYIISINISTKYLLFDEEPDSKIINKVYDNWHISVLVIDGNKNIKP